jgi:hypothetical protein
MSLKSLPPASDAAAHLMHQHVAALLVRVIGHHVTAWRAAATLPGGGSWSAQLLSLAIIETGSRAQCDMETLLGAEGQ